MLTSKRHREYEAPSIVFYLVTIATLLVLELQRQRGASQCNVARLRTSYPNPPKRCATFKTPNEHAVMLSKTRFSFKKNFMIGFSFPSRPDKYSFLLMGQERLDSFRSVRLRISLRRNSELTILVTAWIFTRE